MAPKTKWTKDQLIKLKEIYPITEDWEILYKEFPFSKRGIQGYAAKLGLKKLRISNARHKHDETLFSIWNEKSAYILGYLEADGYVKQRNRSVNITFCSSIKDKIYINELHKLCKSDSKIFLRKHKLKGYKKQYQSIGFVIVSRQWKQDLEGKLRIGKIPDCITEELLPHYIRGYFDGDGCIYWSSQAKCLCSNIVSGSRSFIEDLANRIRTLSGSKLSIYKKTSSNYCWYINMCKYPTIRFVNYIYKNSTIYLERKFKLAKQLFIGV